MKINYVNNNSRVSYEGIFNDVVTDVNSNEKTNSGPAMFEIENVPMNDIRLIEGIKLVIAKAFNNDINTFAEAAGWPVEYINAFLAGSGPHPEKLIGVDADTTASGGKYIQIGNRSDTAYTGNNCTHYHSNNDKNIIQNLRAIIRDKDNIINQQLKVIAFYQKRCGE